MSICSRVLIAAALCLAAGCAPYAPTTVDPKTGRYQTLSEIDKSAYRDYDTSVDPGRFRFIALTTSTNVYPGRFEFFVRNALADLGATRVLNDPELAALVRMHPKLEGLTSLSDPAAQRRISETVGPMLVMNVESFATGPSRHLALQVIDASTGRMLLRIDDNKHIWGDADSEANLPLLNALRDWYRASAGKAA